jgi:IS5 family transposase
MKQQTLAGLEKYSKTTRRAQFLAEMNRVVPWAELCGLIEPHYPKGSSEGGRPPIPLERMLRVYFLQQWFNLSDPAVEDALYDSNAMREFVGIDLGRESAPDETTVCKFRKLLVKQRLGKTLLKGVNEHLRRQGIKLSNGTIVDATIISAPSSTKNGDGERDPEMGHTAKGKEWHFGMKAHVGVDSRHKLIHTVQVSPANWADSEALPHLLRGTETKVWGDQAYHGQGAVIRAVAPNAQDCTNRRSRYRGGERIDHPTRAKNRNKSRVRAKVEHVFGVIKNIFGFRKVRYRGLEKNRHRVEVLAALTNLYLMRRTLMRLQG